MQVVELAPVGDSRRGRTCGEERQHRRGEQAERGDPLSQRPLPLDGLAWLARSPGFVTSIALALARPSRSEQQHRDVVGEWAAVRLLGLVGEPARQRRPAHRGRVGARDQRV